MVTAHQLEVVVAMETNVVVGAMATNMVAVAMETNMVVVVMATNMAEVDIGGEDINEVKVIMIDHNKMDINKMIR